MDNWIKKDLKFIWHPYTQMKDCRKDHPILIQRAKGLKLYDSGGNFYYDTIASWWCNVHGHNHPLIKRAIKRQLDALEHVLFAGFTHQPAIGLAQEIISIAPKGLSKVFFSDNGSCAVEAALKISFQYWKNIGKAGKDKFLALDLAYHGDTLGAMSVSGLSLFNRHFSPLMFRSFKAPSPYCYRCPMGKTRNTCAIDCLKPLEKKLQKRAGQICAFIIEPMLMGSAGMIVYPQEYLAGAAELAKRFKVHLILDEVATGFGRTGKMFACEYVGGIAPDFLCLSKGLTAGYLPMGLTLTTDKIYAAFCDDYEKKKTFYHGHTYTANPLACAAALASLEVFRREKPLERKKGLIRILGTQLSRFRQIPIVGDIRHLGFIGALELVKDKKSKRSFSFRERIGYEIYKRGLKDNLILRPLGNVIYLFLPLCVEVDELEDILGRLRRLLEEVSRMQSKKFAL